MIETKACKTMRGFVEKYECLCSRKKIVQHLLTGCKTIARAEYKRQHIILLEKYQYLTGEDLGQRPSMLKKTNFEYSPLSAVLVNNVKKESDTNKVNSK